VSKFNTTMKKLNQVTYTADFFFFENWFLCFDSRYGWGFFPTKADSSPVY